MATAAAAAAAVNKLSCSEDGDNDEYDSSNHFQRINMSSGRKSAADIFGSATVLIPYTV